MKKTAKVRNCYSDAKLLELLRLAGSPALPHASVLHEHWTFTTVGKMHDDNLLSEAKSYGDQCVCDDSYRFFAAKLEKCRMNKV